MSAIPKKKKVGKKVGKKKIFVKNTKSSVNTKTTLEKGGRNPPNVTLDFVLEDLLTYFNVKILHETKKEIEKKYDINKECDDCWPEDDIKRAWGKARRIDKDLRRKRWSVVIVLQLLKIQKEKKSLSGHLVQRCTELSLKDMHDQMKAERENGRGKNCLRSTDDISQAQSSAAPNIVVAAKGAEKNDNKKSNKIIKKQFYVMSYDKEKNNSEWVYEILNVSTLPSYYKKPTFRDSDSDSDYKLSNSNPFKSTGYDRGHLAAAANHTWCQEAYKKTFLMYNITPQYSNFNRGKWKKLEEYCRKKIISETVRNVHVYTGPLYLKETENVGEKVVPSHFFKVVIVEKEGEDIELECYTLPNEKSKDNENSEEDTENDWLNPYKVDITDIEKMSGLKFTESCPELTKEDYTRTATWMGNKGKKSVTIDVTISSCKKNYEDPQGFNEE
ncbi:Endonuclease G, mitochondrial [Labeo rohita]|uniref:Endonuclease G, mitochondrial n=1 Tax=Labeo rohita TaxID=84645 RepID=A0ABQ8MVU0_LABRO|nr:Endonuclease G, mitochondrial [Labeo rohita]